MKALHAAAAKLPGVTEGVACAGTALESRTLKIGDKAFAFFGPMDLRIKLSASLKEARQLAKSRPGSCAPSSGGWTKATFGEGALPLEVLSRWVAESYALFAPAPYNTMKLTRGPKRAPTKQAAAKRKRVPAKRTRRA
jgi:hypothetical protein